MVKVMARTIVIRFRLRSMMVVPEKVEGKAPPKVSDKPAPFPE